MKVVLEQFVQSLVDSGLMTAQQIDTVVESFPEEKRPRSGDELAKLLYKKDKLTKFQAQALYQGKSKLVLGDYILLDQIGKGGMGQVFKARHKVMKRVVALKTLPAEATKSEKAVQRFYREVEVAARLSHPNIVTAHDAGEDHGVHFLVMEYVEGNDLAAHVRRHGRLPVNMALDYIKQAAEGLQYAHSQKVIHRDIKPSNLLLDKMGNVKILDMGLARLNARIGEAGGTDHLTLTGTGEAMGTIDYMPPEQAVNTKAADARSDIYSLGCTLHYLLVGQSVYQGDTSIQRLLAHRDAEIPLIRAERPDVPEEVDQLFRKMVAKEPDDRHRSMPEVIAELEQCLAPRPGQFEETVDMSGVPPSSPEVETQPVHATEDTSTEDASRLDLNLPVASPMDEYRRTHPKRSPLSKRQMLIGGAAAVGMLFLLFLGIVLLVRTLDGTLVVEINEDDAVVEVLDDEGTVEIQRKGVAGKLSIAVDPGKHRLKVGKQGFFVFTEDFVIESGGEKVIAVRLEPIGVARARSERVKATQPVEKPKIAEEEAVPPPDPAAWNGLVPADAPAPAVAPFDASTAAKHQQAWADYLDVPVEQEVDLGDGVNLTMVLIPPGEFVMGSPVEERTRLLEEARAANDTWAMERIPTEGPQHRVRITKAFRLGRHEVTVGQFRQFVDQTGYKTEAERDGQGGRGRVDGDWVQDPRFVWNTDPGFGQTDDHPVVNVSWNDAVAFCEWLSEKEEAEFVLPSEAQWEYACRCGTTTAWYCGDSDTVLEEYAWFNKNSGEQTQPAGRLKANGWGLHDVHGNVWEWCADRWATDYYAQSPPDDPSGPITGSGRVLRGGGWYGNASYCRSAYRFSRTPDIRNDNLGFRLASVLADK